MPKVASAPAHLILPTTRLIYSGRKKKPSGEGPSSYSRVVVRTSRRSQTKLIPCTDRRRRFPGDPEWDGDRVQMACRDLVITVSPLASRAFATSRSWGGLAAMLKLNKSNAGQKKIDSNHGK